MRIRLLSALLVLPVLLAACDSGGGGPSGPPVLEGVYQFESPPDGEGSDAVNGRITIAERGDSLVGSGEVRFLDSDNTVIASFLITDVEGTHNHPDVSMQWEIDGEGPYSDVGPWTIEGTANNAGDTINGTLIRTEDETADIVLRRQ